MPLLDQNGNPFNRGELEGVQSARDYRVMQLSREFASHPSVGLTPATLATLLKSAEGGDLTRQMDLAEDMEEKDAHLYAELAKRKRNVASLDWTVQPPKRNPTRQEQDAAAYVNEVMQDIPEFEDLLLNLGDAILKGYSCIEIEWDMVGREWIPRKLHHREPRWFQVPEYERDQIRLRDGSANGLELQPFGWICHKHAAKSGYVTRSGLVRVLAWPYLFKNYSIGDLAQLLDVYGLPIKIGKYPPGSSETDKATLLSAISSIGHNAGGIMPESMMMEFHNAAEGRADLFQVMIKWAEDSISKAILGNLMSNLGSNDTGSYALSKTLETGQWDIAVNDAMQIASSLTYYLVYPLLALNRGWSDMRRCPRAVFDTEWPEDIQLYSDALPKLAGVGMQIPVKWAHSKLRIPQPEGDEEVLTPASTGFAPLKGDQGRTQIQAQRHDQDLIFDASNALGADYQTWIGDRVKDMRRLLTESNDLQGFRAALKRLAEQAPQEAIQEALAQAGFSANILGRYRQQRDG